MGHICSMLVPLTYLTQLLCSMLGPLTYLTQLLCSMLGPLTYLTQLLCSMLDPLTYLTQLLCSMLGPWTSQQTGDCSQATQYSLKRNFVNHLINMWKLPFKASSILFNFTSIQGVGGKLYNLSINYIKYLDLYTCISLRSS